MSICVSQGHWKTSLSVLYQIQQCRQGLENKNIYI